MRAQDDLQNEQLRARPEPGWLAVAFCLAFALGLVVGAIVAT